MPSSLSESDKQALLAKHAEVVQKCRVEGCSALVLPRLGICRCHWKLLPHTLQREILCEEDSGAHKKLLRKAVREVADAQENENV